MHLYLMRHGEALSRQQTGVSTDAERTLSVGGTADVRRIAEGLKALGVRPQRILHSPLTRAAQTAELLAKSVYGDSGRVTVTRSLHPEEDPPAFLEELQRLRLTDDALIAVGHQPLLGRIATRVVFGEARDGLAIEPGGVVSLRLPEFPKSVEGVFAGLWNPAVFAGLRP